MRHEGARGGDAQARLTRALIAAAAASGCALTVDLCHARPWASATFVGEQLVLHVSARPTAAALAWLAALPEAELPIHGFVAMPPVVEGTVEAADQATCQLTVLVLNAD